MAARCPCGMEFGSDGRCPRKMCPNHLRNIHEAPTEPPVQTENAEVDLDAILREGSLPPMATQPARRWWDLGFCSNCEISLKPELERCPACGRERREIIPGSGGSSPNVRAVRTSAISTAGRPAIIPPRPVATEDAPSRYVIVAPKAPRRPRPAYDPSKDPRAEPSDPSPRGSKPNGFSPKK